MRKDILVFAIAIALLACRKQQELRDVRNVASPPTYAIEAVRLLQGTGFQTVIESRHDESIAPGFVLDYRPAGPQPPGATIWLTVATRDSDQFPFTREDETHLSDARAKELDRFYRRQVKLPVHDVTGVAVVNAIRQLQGRGFRVALTTALDSTQPPGTVVSQLPPAETELRWGSSVTISVAATQPYDAHLSDADAEKLSQATAETLQTVFDSMSPAG